MTEEQTTADAGSTTPDGGRVAQADQADHGEQAVQGSPAAQTTAAPPAQDDAPPAQDTSAAPEAAAASGGEAGKRSWRGRSRASRSEKQEKPAKEKAEKPPKEKKEKSPSRREKKEQAPVEKKRRSGVAVGVNQVRTLVARLVWLVCLVFALALAITALLIALEANADNEAVRFIVSFADRVDLGIFDLANPIKDFDTDQGPARDVKTALFNYGIGAVVWLLIGRIGDKVIKP